MERSCVGALVQRFLEEGCKQLSNWHTGTDWSYSGSGSYTRTLALGTLSGTIEGGGGEGYDYQTSRGAVVSNGTWVSSGSESLTTHSSDS